MTMGVESSMRLVTTSESSTTQLVPTKDGSAIDITSTGKIRAIKEFGGRSNEVVEVSIIDVNSIKIFISAKSKDLVKPKEFGVGFLTPRAKLTFTKLRQTFIKVFILHYFDLE